MYGLFCLCEIVEIANSADSQISNEPQESVLCIMKDSGESNGGALAAAPS